MSLYKAIMTHTRCCRGRLAVTSMHFIKYFLSRIQLKFKLFTWNVITENILSTWTSISTSRNCFTPQFMEPSVASSKMCFSSYLSSSSYSSSLLLNSRNYPSPKRRLDESKRRESYPALAPEVWLKSDKLGRRRKTLYTPFYRQSNLEVSEAPRHI